MLVDDERTRVTRFEFLPDQETGWHEHQYDGENTSVFVAAGDAYRRNAGVKHNVINNGKVPMSFIEIELK